MLFEEEAPEELSAFDEITAPCDACGQENVGVGQPIRMIIPGMLFPSREYDCSVFIPDPDVKIKIVMYPNGTMGFVTDEQITKYAHNECYELLIDELLTQEQDEEDDE